MKSYIRQHRSTAIVIGILAVSVIFLMWSDGRGPARVLDANVQEGEVEAVLEEQRNEDGPLTRTETVQRLLVLLDSGERIAALNDVTPLGEGDRAWFVIQSDVEGAEHFVAQPRRTRGLALIAALFVGLVLIIARGQGARALTGMLASLAIIIGFMVPQILNGSDPVAIGLLGALFILAVTLFVSHGVNRKSLSAFAGIMCALVLVAILATLSVHGLGLTGLGSEEIFYLNVESDVRLNIIGLLTAGIIIAAIGVLDDVGVTQASTVWELARADASLRGRKLFRRAMVVGRDHIAAVTNTLVLAYVGAALPLVLLLHLARFPIPFVLSGDVLAEEILLTLLSSIGLVLAVPLTTAIAVALVSGDTHLHHGKA